ncbi:hypothetical protein ACFPPI_003282 [Salmonella enterica]|nr:hypothetical protein [Salmonella enterica]
MTTITKERIELFVKSPLENGLTRGEQMELARIALASLDAKPIYQYQSGIYNDDNGETDWYWDDCDAGFYKQYAADRRRIVYTAAPAPVVPEEMNFSTACNFVQINGMAKEDRATLAMRAWNACRAAMLQAGNSPVIPDGYTLVPVEPTDEMIAAAMNCEDVLFNSDESFCVQFGNIYEAMLAAAPQQ